VVNKQARFNVGLAVDVVLFSLVFVSAIYGTSMISHHIMTIVTSRPSDQEFQMAFLCLLWHLRFIDISRLFANAWFPCHGQSITLLWLNGSKLVFAQLGLCEGSHSRHPQ
jgi:hypothetical protein